MIIEIRQAGFVNKGAELMLNAVNQKIKERYPEAYVVMAPTYGGPEDTLLRMSKLGILPKAWFWKKGIDFAFPLSFLPKKLRQKYGLILNQDVDVVLDAAGFWYSDQWGDYSSQELASSSNTWKRNGTLSVLLPQAFGPFEKGNIQKYVKQWVNNIDLIFARETDSFNYLTGVTGKLGHINQSVDFTNGIKGRLPDSFDQEQCKIALIPNYRMVDKTSESESKAYIPFMILAARYLIEKGKKPFVLVHEGEADLRLAQQISSACGNIPIVEESDPLFIKGIIGASEATIGSRFHGLVSALSQGVPSLATGWSHKYERLFSDYCFEEGIVSVTDNEDVIKAKIDLIIDLGTATILTDKLLIKSHELKNQTEAMWEKVFSLIDSKFNK
jgi:polysaccharide pyruvyl transferase WcaK-like protein